MVLFLFLCLIVRRNSNEDGDVGVVIDIGLVFYVRSYVTTRRTLLFFFFYILL